MEKELNAFTPSEAQQRFRETALWVVDRLYHYKIRGNEDEKNLDLLKSDLETGNSAVVMFNHTFLGDPVIALSVLYKALGVSIPVGGPGSKKHYDLIRYPRDAIFMRLTAPLGIELVPIVQHYDKTSYTLSETREHLEEFIAAASALLNEPGSILIIAPEGTRSETGKLNRAQRGIEKFSRWNNTVSYLPMAIIPENWTRGLGIGGNYEVRIGKPFRIPEIRGEEIPSGLRLADAIMLRIATLLPQEMRGFYAPYLETQE